MKASSRPFKPKYAGARCPICPRRITKDDLIVRLEKTVTWTEEKRNAYGKAYLARRYADYAHAGCMEDKDETGQ
jgi:hypothetical protein